MSKDVKREPATDEQIEKLRLCRHIGPEIPSLIARIDAEVAARKAAELLLDVFEGDPHKRIAALEAALAEKKARAKMWEETTASYATNLSEKLSIIERLEAENSDLKLQHTEATKAFRQVETQLDAENAELRERAEKAERLADIEFHNRKAAESLRDDYAKAREVIVKELAQRRQAQAMAAGETVMFEASWESEVAALKDELLKERERAEKLEIENAELREVLAEVTTDLAEEVQGRYGDELGHVRGIHPAMRSRFDRDMESVGKARKLLEASDGSGM